MMKVPSYRLIVLLAVVALVSVVLFADLARQIPSVERGIDGDFEHHFALPRSDGKGSDSARPAHTDVKVSAGAPGERAVAAPATFARAPTWRLREGRSCQDYADGDVTVRDLESSKVACLANVACVAIECTRGRTNSCTLRALLNFVEYIYSDCYERVDPPEAQLGHRPTPLHPRYHDFLERYPFQSVRTQSGQEVNIILVRSPFKSSSDRALYEKYKDEILFLGISSFEDYPLDSMNPFSPRLPDGYYTSVFPGFLHMMREPEKHFAPHVKTILMSQSDFQLPNYPERDYSVPRKYDFTLSGSDQEVDYDCVGWSSYAKNWSFVKEALVVMCGEYKLRGVLVATMNKKATRACTIPDSCKGLMIQTTYLEDQSKYFDYVKQSRFAFLPQVHDASPRVATQALAIDVPLLMNAHISGGWKYINEKTGEFFHDMSDFRPALEKILKHADIEKHYEPRKWVLENYGNKNSGPRLLKFVQDNFADRITLPKHTTHLLI